MIVHLFRRLGAYFRAPVFPDEEQTGRAALLNVTLICAAFLSVGFIIAEYFGGRLTGAPVEPRTAAIGVAALACFLLLRHPLRGGWLDIAAWGFLIVAVAAVTTGLVVRSWPAAPMVGTYVLIIVIAGLLLEGRVVLLLVAAISVILAGLIWADASGVLSNSIEAPLVTRIAVTTGLLLGSAGVVQTARRFNSRLIHRLRRELSERLRAEQALGFSEERLRSLLAALPDFIVTLTPEGVYTDIFTQNAIHEQRRGFPRGALIGRALEEVFPAGLAAELRRKIDEAVSGGQVLDYEYPVQGPDGLEYWYGARLASYQAPEGLRVVWLARDISDYKRAERDLQQLTADLEDRVAERTARLESANRELEAFAYSVSHDLRAPLRAVSSYAQLLDEDHAAALPEDGRSMLAHVRRAAARMSDLIDNLLRLSRMGSQPIDRRPVAMDDVARETARVLLDQAGGDSAVALEIDPMPTILADPILIQRVYANLFENAYKYSQACPQPRIHAGCFDLDAETVFFVRDNGVGFDQRYADRIFAAFERLHPADEYEGTGLGLAITRRIVERHGGRIWAEGKVNEGATIYFTIPA